MSDPSTTQAARRNFFAARWAGEVPLRRVFFTDMLAIGSIANMAGVLCAILLMLAGSPAWLGALAYIAPLPYNVFIVLAVWRTLDATQPPSAGVYRLVALVWLAIVVVV